MACKGCAERRARMLRELRKIALKIRIGGRREHGQGGQGRGHGCRSKSAPQ